MSPVRNQPSAVNDAVGAGIVVVALGDPGPAHDQLAGVLAVPGKVLALVAEDADLDPDDRDSLLETHGHLLLFGPVLHRGLEPRDGPDRRGLGHAPGVQDRQAEVLFKAVHQGPRGGGPADQDRLQAGQVVRPVLLLFEILVEQRPDRGDARRGGHSLRLDQLGDRLADHHRPRQDLLGPGHRARVRQAPGVDVEHGHDRENDLFLAHAAAIDRAAGHGVQKGRAVAVEDPLGFAGRPRRVAEPRGHVLIELGKLGLLGCRGQ